MGSVERLKWWHWIAISLILGALLGYVNANNADAPVMNGSMSDIVLEQKLLSTVSQSNGEDKIPWISDVLIHPVRQIGSEPNASKIQLVSFSCYNIPDRAHPNGWSETYTLMAPYPFEPRPRAKTLRQQSYPGAFKYAAQEGDTLESIMKTFYGQITPAGRQAIIYANESLRRAKNPADIVILPFRVYWIPWNPADKHTFNDFMAEVNKTIAKSPNDYAGAINYRYAWWETPNCVYEIAMLGSFVIVGLIWPALLFLMVKGGFGSKGPNSARKPQYHIEPELQPTSTVITAGDLGQLRDLEESLTASLTRADRAVPTQAAVVKVEPAIKKLESMDADSSGAQVPPTEESKEYNGEFYPVVKPHGLLKH